MKNRWYKVIIQHGPGHQSKEEWYRYSSTENIKDEVDSEVEQQYFEWPVVTITSIKKIPDKYREELIKDHKIKIKCSRGWLNFLNGKSKSPYTKE